METIQSAQAFHFLQHGGEMGNLTRQFNWSETTIGTPNTWPQALRISLATVLNSGFPMFLFWGPDLTCFYNEAFRPSLGTEGKHPAVGKAGKEVWAEIWDFIGPLINGVLAESKPVWFENQLVPFYRNGKIEDIYWTFSYSLIANDDGLPGGVLVTCMETTASVQAHRRVEESEVQLKALISQNPVPTLVLRGDEFLIDQINDSMLEMMGRGPEVLGQPLLAVMPELEGQYAWSQLCRVYYEGIAFDQAELLVPYKRNGVMQNFYYNVAYRPLREAGVITGIVQAATDVTEHVLARRKLEESEAKLRSIINSAPTAIGVFVGPDLIVENANQLMIEVMAAGPDIEGKSFRKLLTGLVEEDQKFLQIIDGVRTTGQPFEALEVGVFFKPQKLTRYFNINFIPLRDESGAVYAVLDVSVDVTDQVAARKKVEESETFNRTVLENSPDCVKIIDAEGRLQFMNTNGLCTMEIDDFGAFKNQLWEDLWGEENRELVQASIATALTGETAQFQAFCPTAKGNPKWWDVMISPVKLPGSGQITSIVSVSRDITEQIGAQKKIEESKENYRTMFNSMDQGYCTLEVLFDGDECVDFRYLEVNPSFERHLGMAGALGKTIREIAPDIEPKWFAFYGGVALSSNPIRIEEESKAFNKWFEVYALRVGRPEERKVAVFFTDVTARRKADEATRQSEVNLRNMILQAPVAICIFRGPEFVIEIANEKMFEFWGKSPEQVMSKPLFEGIPEAANQGYEELMLNVLTTGQTFAANELPVTLPRNGVVQNVFINFTYQPLHEKGGHISGIMAVAIDVTEQVAARQKLEENEKALETALEQVRLSKEAAELGTFDIDPVSGDMHWDKRCRTLFGISHNGPVSFDLDFIKRLHPDDQLRVPEVVNRAFNKPASNGDYDVEYRTIGAEDGIERWVRAKGKVYFDSNDKPFRFIGSVLDITEQMSAMQKIERTVEERTRELAEANIALQNSNKELQRSNAHLEEFAHAASHDLKEPVRKITFFTHRLKDQLADRLKEDERFSFGRIENATVRMGLLIDDLLLYSHVSQRPHQTEAVDMNQKVARVLEDLELDVQEKKAIVTVEELPLVQGYGRQLQQLFQNLISNALKYSKAGVPPRIAITARQEEEDGRLYHVFAVADNGIGFEQQYADKIFQMFARLHGKAEYGGTGVGLSIVKKVVENHSGFIRVESTVGEGALFRIYLPV